MDIQIDDLTGSDIIALLTEHMNAMLATSPRESCHFLDLDGLRQPEITFWSGWIGGELAGCIALKELDPQQGEIKSMRTAQPFLKQGVARGMLEHLIEVARQRGYQRLNLETGSMAYFEPARRLYAQSGFATCAPFGDYVADPNSFFMTRPL